MKKTLRFGRPQSILFITCSLLILFISPIAQCRADSIDEVQPLCTVDPATGEDDCEAVYDETHDFPVPTNADGLEEDEDEAYEDEDEAYKDLYAVWGKEDQEGNADDQDENEDEYNADEQEWSSKCQDRHDNCRELADNDECETNPGFMHFQCPASCGTCEEYSAALFDGEHDGPPCTDNEESCKSWAASGECAFNPGFMRNECRRSCMQCFVSTNQFGKTQDIPPEDDENHAKTKKYIDESVEYMKKLWSGSNPDNDRVNYKCRNLEAECSYWAAHGECESNEVYMRVNCAPVCQTCEALDIRLKCPITEDNKMVYKPGDLNKLMERIVDNSDGKGKYLKYNPKAISRPKIKSDGTAAQDVEVDGPWIVLFENFVSENEANALIAAGAKRGYERSADVGEENPDGSHEESVNDDRTSMNAWCDVELCNEDLVIGPVIERIADVTETPVENSEFLQLLRYEPGQYYRRHHDYIEYQENLPCGPRALTMFLYLNDVEEGGGTRFPMLDITVQPKLGSAILWPSVLDNEPEMKDFRTDHEALEVIKGIKYGANAWIHTRDYWDADANGCT